MTFEEYLRKFADSCDDKLSATVYPFATEGPNPPVAIIIDMNIKGLDAVQVLVKDNTVTLR
jgi:hypothetical protein